MLRLELIDQWGDGWSGAMVTIQVEGVDWRTFEATGSGQTETFASSMRQTFHWFTPLVSGSKTISIRSLTAMGTSISDGPTQMRRGL